jgi:tetratricopeptide (TPR) repeat protein
MVRNADWRDEASLYGATLAAAPMSAKAHFNFAVVRDLVGDDADAMWHYGRALEIYPGYGLAMLRIGQLHGRAGQRAAALDWFERALRADWALAPAHLEIALLRQREGAGASAEMALDAALEVEPDDPMLLVNLAAARLTQGDRWGARAALARLDAVPPPLDATKAAVVARARDEIERGMR